MKHGGLRLVGALLGLLAVGGAVAAEAPAKPAPASVAWNPLKRVEAELLMWFPRLNGNARKSAQNVATDVVNLRRDLGIANNNFPEVRVNWQFGQRSQLRLAYTQWGYDGNSAGRPNNFTFNGQVYNTNDTILTHIYLSQARAAYHWQPYQSKYVQLGLLFNVSMFWGHMDLSVPSRGVNSTAKVRVPLPSPGATLHITPSKQWDIFAEAYGIPAGSVGHLLDLETGVKLSPSPEVSLKGAFRLFELKARDHNDFVDARLSGPYLAADIHF